MKKSLLTMAAALALVSCSQDDLMTGIENRPSGAIDVKPYVPTITRGTALNSEGDLVKAGNGFDLFAFLGDANSTQFMGTASNGVAFQGSGDDTYAWDYVSDNEMKFWSEAKGSAIKFYAISPMNEKTTTLTTGSLTKNITAEKQELTYTVPTTCSEQVDLMYAVTDEYASNDETAEHITNGITLQFRHALSQIVFKAKTESELIYADIESVKITNLNGAGTFNLANAETYRTAETTATFPWNYTGEANSTFAAEITETTDINTDAISLTESSKALLLLPQNLKTNSSALEISCKVRYKRGDDDIADIVGSTDTYATITVPVETSWKPGYKYTYTLIFTAEMGNPIKVKSVGVDEWNDAAEDVKVEGEGEKESTLAVKTALPTSGYSRKGATEEIELTSNLSDAPTVSYSSDGKTWHATASDANVAWITVSEFSENASARAAESTFQYNITTAAIQSSTSQNSYQNALKANAAKGSTENPWDLSMYDIYGEPTKQNTANCYVVNAAGTYKFPVKYGNAVKDGESNSSAFSNAYCATNYIYESSTLSAESAELLWETTSGLITDVFYANNYVTFTVNEGALNEGNAVIAVKDGGDIKWSWHIWVTPVDLTPVVTNNETNASAMPVNLGWVSDGSSNTTVTTYEARNGWVRFTQGKKTVDVEVKQNGYCCAEGAITGTQAYYQWGRKDPFVTGNFTTEGSGSVYYSIQNPSVFYTSEPNTFDCSNWFSSMTTNANLWCGSLSATSKESVDATTKTIFDPCPSGFAVAPTTAFKGLEQGTWNDGYTLNVSGRNIYFPASGCLYSTDGSLTETSGGYSLTSTMTSGMTADAFSYTEDNWYTDGGASLGDAVPVRPVAEQKQAQE